jgi:hypothetical protein
VEWDAILPPPISEYSACENERLRRFGKLIESIETHSVHAYPVTVMGEQVMIEME